MKIETPEKTYKPQKADKVVLPVMEGNLTIIEGRAPRSQLLTEGALMLLDAQNTVIKKWHIGTGVAEIAQDVCQIAVENIEEV